MPSTQLENFMGNIITHETDYRTLPSQITFLAIQAGIINQQELNCLYHAALSVNPAGNPKSEIDNFAARLYDCLESENNPNLQPSPTSFP